MRLDVSRTEELEVVDKPKQKRRDPKAPAPLPAGAIAIVEDSEFQMNFRGQTVLKLPEIAGQFAVGDIISMVDGRWFKGLYRSSRGTSPLIGQVIDGARGHVQIVHS